MSTLSPARAVAFSCLMEASESSCPVRDVLDRSDVLQGLDHRDAGLARRLALGVTATAGCLDEVLDRSLDHPNRVSARVRMALRIPVFELLYLGRAPEVAVSQGVELVRSQAKGATGLANAVLRRVAEGREPYLAAGDVPEGERSLVRLARSSGMPVWLVRELEASLGDGGARELCACELEQAPTAIHLNAFRSDGSMEAWRRAAGPGDLLPGCLVPADARTPIASGAFERADAVASDLHAQLIATAATRPGTCLEIGAGRGTKTFVMACQERRAGIERTHVALDLSAPRCRQNEERLARADISGVEVLAGDACELDAALAPVDTSAGRRILFQTVLVDAPCSGTGTMRRHPEIPWRLHERDVSDVLPSLQLSLLEEASRRVDRGGELLYSTCSVLVREDAEVVEAFLASEAGRDFFREPVSSAPIFALPDFSEAGGLLREAESSSGSVLFAPCPKGFDGHFCARLVRRD